MIVSHRHRFIFVKTSKTGGTSLEAAFAPELGPDDIATPVWTDGPDAARRIAVPGRNYRKALGELGVAEWGLLVLTGRRRAKFNAHEPAAAIREAVGRAVWDAYWKVAVFRHPYDRAISAYYWQHRRRPEDAWPTFRAWVASEPAYLADCWARTSEGGRYLLDEAIRYDRLGEGLDGLGARLGLDGLRARAEAMRMKGGRRPPGATVERMLDAETKAVIRRVCAAEFALCGFEP